MTVIRRWICLFVLIPSSFCLSQGSEIKVQQLADFLVEGKRLNLEVQQQSLLMAILTREAESLIQVNLLTDSKKEMIQINSILSVLQKYNNTLKQIFHNTINLVNENQEYKQHIMKTVASYRRDGMFQNISIFKRFLYGLDELFFLSVEFPIKASIYEMNISILKSQATLLMKSYKSLNITISKKRELILPEYKIVNEQLNYILHQVHELADSIEQNSYERNNLAQRLQEVVLTLNLEEIEKAYQVTSQKGGKKKSLSLRACSQHFFHKK